MTPWGKGLYGNFFLSLMAQGREGYNMTMKYTILPLLLSLTLSGCQQVSKTDHQTEQNALEETYLRKHQRTIRFNCDGVAVSDQIETINSVSRTYTLAPKFKKNLWGFSATNVTTRSSAGGLWNNLGKFTLDLAPTVFNIRAREGLNQIEWKFTYCSKRSTEEHTCLEPLEVKEEGRMFIRVTQQTVLEPGLREIRPTPEQCQKP
jgi:hypothetical protein